MRRVRSALVVGIVALFISSCSPPVDEPQGAAAPPSDYQVGRGSSASTMGTQREHQAAFLQRIRNSDPQFRAIERAVFNERNELGVVLDRTVEMDSVPQLMRSLLTQMAREFPGQDLTILAYAPADPPMRLGVARLDARTRQMTYTADRPQQRY
jgi:hypothetical protein